METLKAAEVAGPFLMKQSRETFESCLGLGRS